MPKHSTDKRQMQTIFPKSLHLLKTAFTFGAVKQQDFMKKQGFFRKAMNVFFVAVGFVTVFGLTLAGIVIYVGMEKQGKTFADLFSLKPSQPVEKWSGETPTLPKLEEIAVKQAAESYPAPPKQLTKGNGKAAPSPVAYSAPKKTKAGEYGTCASCKRFHDLGLSCADDAAFVNSTLKKGGENPKPVAKPKFKTRISETGKSELEKQAEKSVAATGITSEQHQTNYEALKQMENETNKLKADFTAKPKRKLSSEMPFALGWLSNFGL